MTDFVGPQPRLLRLTPPPALGRTVASRLGPIRQVGLSPRPALARLVASLFGARPRPALVLAVASLLGPAMLHCQPFAHLKPATPAPARVERPARWAKPAVTPA
ncbi:hypothetical protein [Amycolatopsis sp. NPDC004169]|uniref:hypothetical protein n=1 Tax=Amycolatopsis sp. NPDC004169 TaxID=3154453 RepID=UPI0033AEED44